MCIRDRCARRATTHRARRSRTSTSMNGGLRSSTRSPQPSTSNRPVEREEPAMNARVLVSVLVLGGLFQLGAPSALAQTRADCLACHSDSTLTKEGPGKKPVSLFVTEAVLNKSTHAKLACVACHTGFNPDDLPHKAKIEPVA